MGRNCGRSEVEPGEWRQNCFGARLFEKWRVTAATAATAAPWRRCWRRWGLRTMRWTSRSSSTWKGTVPDVHLNSCADTY